MCVIIYIYIHMLVYTCILLICVFMYTNLDIHICLFISASSTISPMFARPAEALRPDLVDRPDPAPGSPPAMVAVLFTDINSLLYNI